MPSRLLQKHLAPQWPGQPVSRQEMLVYLDAVLSPERLTAPQHYAYPLQGAERDADILYKMRLCWFETPEPLMVRAAFDGALQERKLCGNDIFIGSYNSSNSVIEPLKAVYGGFSVVFHLHHVRLHYGFFEHGREVKNIYYHTPHPATGILALLADALDRMIHETGTSRPERCRPLLETILRQLKYELTAECDSVQGQHGKLAMRLKNYLEHNFSHPIDCSGISDALGINRSYASTIFHAAFGVTMKEYLTTLRLEAAEELLTSEDGVKVEDIARFCAFSSTGYFIKVFRERYGVSPGEYRKKNINF